MTEPVLHQPRRLTLPDTRLQFDSGAPELDQWFKKFAWENMQAGNAVTYVMFLGETLAGYYSLSAAAVRKDELPHGLSARRPASTPCILLARFAIDATLQGRGLGSAMLHDAVNRAANASHSIGAAALLVHCRDELAKDFYTKHAEFLELNSNSLHLWLPMKAIRRASG